MHWVGLVMGGAIGTIARLCLSSTVQKIAGGNFPFGTMVVNILGCFLMGVFVSIAELKETSVLYRYCLIIGFCGAFTTFSAYIFEASELIRHGDSMKAFAYLLITIAIGFIFFRLGVLLIPSK